MLKRLALPLLLALALPLAACSGSQGPPPTPAEAAAEAERREQAALAVETAARLGALTAETLAFAGKIDAAEAARRLREVQLALVLGRGIYDAAISTPSAVLIENRAQTDALIAGVLARLATTKSDAGEAEGGDGARAGDGGGGQAAAPPVTTEAIVKSAEPFVIAVVVPLIVAGLRKLLPSISPALLPILAGALGPGLDQLVALTAGTPSSPLLAIVMGLAGVGVREVKHQFQKAVASA